MGRIRSCVSHGILFRSFWHDSLKSHKGRARADSGLVSRPAPQSYTVQYQAHQACHGSHSLYYKSEYHQNDVEAVILG